MDKATYIMRDKINSTNFEKPKNIIISNVTGSETQDIENIKDLLIKQIESPVLWRESVIYMIKKGVTNFIEIGPGKVLSGLVKRIDKIKDLLIKQIESPVRWRESVIYMIENGVTNFIEIGPGKVLSGLIKRIDKTIKINTINKFEDLNEIA